MRIPKNLLLLLPPKSSCVPLLLGVIISANVHAATNAPRPVVLVHGYQADTGVWSNMVSEFIQKGGYKVKSDGSYCVVDKNSQKLNDCGDVYLYYYGDSKEKISSLSNQFRNWVERQFGDQQIDIVAHSMGSLVTRFAIKGYDGDDGRTEKLHKPLQGQVSHWVSLAGPNHGAKGADAAVGPAWPDAIRDMGASSYFLKALNSGDEAPLPTKYLTYRTPCDEKVSEGSVMLKSNNVQNRRIDLCPKVKGSGSEIHNAILHSPKVIKETREFITSGRVTCSESEQIEVNKIKATLQVCQSINQNGKLNIDTIVNDVRFKTSTGNTWFSPVGLAHDKYYIETAVSWESPAQGAKQINFSSNEYHQSATMHSEVENFSTINGLSYHFTLISPEYSGNRWLQSGWYDMPGIISDDTGSSGSKPGVGGHPPGCQDCIRP